MQKWAQFAVDKRGDALAAVERVGVADAFHAIAVPQANDDELGVGHHAVHGILHGKRQRKTVQRGFHV